MSTSEEAARWFTVLRRGVMTLEERSAYDLWIEDSSHRSAMAEMQRVWQMFEAVHDSSAPQAARQDQAARSLRKVMVAVMCAVSLGLVALSCVHTPFWTSLNWVTR